MGDLRGKKSGKREKERGEDYFEGVLRLAFKDLRFWKRRDFFQRKRVEVRIFRKKKTKAERGEGDIWRGEKQRKGR